MRMTENFSFKSWGLFLFLLLFGSSSPAFSAKPEAREVTIAANSLESFGTSVLGEQVNSLFDSILPLHKQVFFQAGSSGTIANLGFRCLCHTTATHGYLKRSRFIEPGLGRKQVIFPFHVFF